jgi:hypothetical protein
MTSRSKKYYDNNPEAKKKKAKKDKEINARPEQRAKRSELVQKNREADKRGVNRDGKDYDHATNSYVSKSTNRGRKNGTKGDKNARGK